MTTTAPPHPARFTPSIMDTFAELAARHDLLGASVLDPFAGTGGMHDLGLDSVGVEIAGVDDAHGRGQ